ncbi:dockerin type I repeat-containing protein [Ruminococcus sp.]|uniref:dockerin type I repeat-containing protein n=1 Tax=Ruminococcus sp. TaxID=41978 RepID=UPI0025FA66BD|nr:dockerin type I repeat-containing protein [Ruminococcus sp.]
MKKIACLAATVLTTSSAIPCIPDASVEMNVKNIPHLTYYYPLEVELKTMRSINERNLDFDFNSDGKFDHLDCYLLGRYNDYPGSEDSLPEDIRAKISANADLDEDGQVESYEKGNIFCHFLLYCDIDTSLFAKSTYEKYEEELGLSNRRCYNSRNIVLDLNDRAVYLGVNYLFMQKMIDEGKVDPDVNNDGKFDLADVLDYTIATTSEPWVKLQDPDTGLWSLQCAVDKKIELDEETKERSNALTVVQSDDNYSQVHDVSALLDCLFLTEPVLPEYTDNTYYEKFRDGAQYYYIGDMVSNHLEYIDKASISMPSLEELEQQSNEKAELKKQYFDDIAAGRISEPDLNFDNIIDGRDQHIADLFHGDRLFGRTIEESALSKEEYDNLDQNCDFDHNGISGDDNDLELIGDYIFNNILERTKAMATDSTGEYYEEYANALLMKEMHPDEEPDMFNPFYISGNSIETFVFPTLEDHYNQFLIGVFSNMYPEPDIDGNGTVDKLDKKYAESYLSFLETGEMGETEIPEEVLERIRTKCDYTHDGNPGLLYDMQVAILYIDNVVLKNNDKESEKAPEPTTAEPKEYLAGDTNCDGEVDMSDAVLIMQALANPNKYGIDGTAEYHLTEYGKINGDMNGDGLTVGDAIDIQAMLLGFDDKNS